MDLVRNYINVKDSIKGRLALPEENAVLLQEAVIQYQGDYIEIGTLYGGTLVLAAMLCNFDVYAVDPLDGYYRPGKVDKLTGLVPSKDIVMGNLKMFGEDATIFTQKTPPLPLELENHQFGVGFIDGDHTYRGCLADYQELKNLCRCLVFDNTEKGAVRKVVEKAVREGWTVAGKASGILTGVEIITTVVTHE